MNALVIGDKEYKLPDSYTVRQWCNIQQTLNLDKKIEIAMGIPSEDVELIPEDTKQLISALIESSLNPFWSKLQRDIDGHKLIQFNEMKLGTFIDLEVYVGDGFHKSFDKIVQTIYEMDDVDTIKVTDVWAAVQTYLKWRILLYKQYKNLFNAEHLEEEIEQRDPLKINVSTAHIWYDVVMILADGKFLNIDAVVNRGVIESFNWLAWNKDQKKKEAEALKQQQR